MAAPSVHPGTGWVPSLEALQAAGWPRWIVEPAMRAGLSQVNLFALTAEFGMVAVPIVAKVVAMLPGNTTTKEDSKCQ